jgi:hypothetical protein
LGELTGVMRVTRNRDYVKTLTPPRQNCYISRSLEHSCAMSRRKYSVI